MQTFKQYVSEKRDKLRAKYGLTHEEISVESPESAHREAWRNYIITRFNEGEDIPTKLWRSLDEGLQYRVLRSRRALKSDELTHSLTSKIE